MCVWGPEQQERVLSGQIPSLHDCPIIPSPFPLHFPLSSVLSLPHFIHFYFYHFSFGLLFPLSIQAFSPVTFPLICPLSCKGKPPRWSLISGQSYLHLLSQLRLMAAMLMTYRMGSWAPECRQLRWSPLCSLKPIPQIRPEEDRVIWLVKVVLMNICTNWKVHRRHYLHSFITAVWNGINTKRWAKARERKTCSLCTLWASDSIVSLAYFNIIYLIYSRF